MPVTTAVAKLGAHDDDSAFRLGEMCVVELASAPAETRRWDSCSRAFLAHDSARGVCKLRRVGYGIHPSCCSGVFVDESAESRASLELVCGSELPRSAFGPRLQAAVDTLAERNQIFRRDTTELARELFGVDLSTGSVDAIVQRAGEALAAPHTRLEQEIKRSPVVNIDETGWKPAGRRRTRGVQKFGSWSEGSASS